MTGTVDVYWLEQTESDVPAVNPWLSPREQSRLSAMRFNKRRTDWRLGRWTAKRAVAGFLKLPGDVSSLQDIEIRAAPSGAPEVFLFDQRVALSLSLSHRAGRALCVIGLSGGFGCDLELVESRDRCFVADFFSANEQNLIGRAPADQRPVLETLLWSAKESALKALHVGLRLDTTFLEVSPSDDALQFTPNSFQNHRIRWLPLLLRTIGDQSLRGWWRYGNDMVRTVVFNPSQ